MPVLQKMQRLIFLLPLVLLLGCGDPASSNPEESAKIFAEGILERDWETVCDMLDQKSRDAAGDQCAEQMEGAYGLVSTIYKRVRTQLRWREKEYTVVATGSVPERVYLRWEDGAWRVMIDPPRYLEQVQ